MLAWMVHGFLPQKSARADENPSSHEAAPAPAPALPRAAQVDGEIDDWPPGTPPPPGYRWDSRSHGTLVNIGTGLFAIGYAPALAIGSTNNEDLLHPGAPHSLWLIAPLAGPFVLLGDASSDVERVLLLTDGAFQAAGIAMWVVGLAWRVPILVHDEKAALRVRPAPLLLGRGGGGLALQGTF